MSMGFSNWDTSQAWEGEHVIVVGAAGGIGAELAAQLAEVGAEVSVLDVKYGFDATDAVKAWDWCRQHERIDAVFYAAGIASSGLLAATDLSDELRTVYATNVAGAVNMARAAAAQLRESGGRFVTLNSAFSLVTAEGFGPYSASKAALSIMTQALRPELAPATVTDCLVGGVRTNIFGSAADRAGTEASYEVNRRFLDRTARLAPSAAAKAILDAAWKRRKRPAIGADAHVIRHFSHIAPAATQRLVERKIGKYPAEMTEENT